MFGYSMIQTVRNHAKQLDRPLRNELVNLYRPFKYTPCFLHRLFEKRLKRKKKLSVIVQFHPEAYESGCYQIGQITKKHRKNKLYHYYSRISCCSADMTPDSIDEMLANCKHVKKVYKNKEIHALLDVAVESANAKEVVRNNTTLTGEGTKIAIVDTGIYPHQDLSGRITDFVDFINGRSEPYDDNGHGTHCAGDVAGNGSASSGKYMGPAPEANVAGVKVLNNVGSGSLDTIMQGVEWCIQYNEDNPDSPIDIMSMSLGTEPQDYGEEDQDPLVQIVEEAWRNGITVCVAAGNSGPDPQTISSPALSDRVITVGALDDRDTADTRSDDDVASFSSRGPTIYGEVKPDILAPGVDIISLRSPNSYIDKLQKSNRVEEYYFTMSGTSMATPICAGVVSLMKQHNPELTPDEIKELLKNGADLWKDRDNNIYGAGYINAENSIPQ
ncbi:S8 family serine peptidase [Gracilibacillus salitolerans]|uniref:S8 family serine peptidase n=1 Tax=Gracilibacillus salitolerans TaxID=2663022 RepID=A0A5Q2TMM2_9BACI|nr:S8 family peptidase [Gracilibacillus salitolerans]QGH35945.1 S8 family serine peptidase [Gracilibacillus salitolerans]